MKFLRNSLVLGVILSVIFSSTAFANPLNDLTKGHLKEANNLVDVFNKSSEDTNSLISRIQNAIDGKDAMVYQELRSLSDALNQNFKVNDNNLAKLELLKNSDCTLAYAENSKSIASAEAIDTCNELRDALGAAKDARGATAQGLDLLINTLFKYVNLLVALDAAVAKANDERDAAMAKAQIEAEKAAAELKAKEESAAKVAAAKVAAAKVAAAKAATLKTTTITCVKGKLTKKVTAVKPVCPAGYNLKF